MTTVDLASRSITCGLRLHSWKEQGCPGFVVWVFFLEVAVVSYYYQEHYGMR